MTTFMKNKDRHEALQSLFSSGWMRRVCQVGGDFEAFVRANGKPGLLLVDFALGRFILDKDGTNTLLLSHGDDAEGDPEYDAILKALYEGEVVQ